MSDTQAGNILFYEAEYPCDYYRDGRICRIRLFFPGPMDYSVYDACMERGFRRYQNFLYYQDCPECRECIPIRLQTSLYKPSKNQRRTLKKNAHVRAVWKDCVTITPEKIGLYSRYRLARYPENESTDYEREITGFMSGYSAGCEMEYYGNGRLLGVSVLDLGRESLSSVYFFYDPEWLPLRPGIYSMAREIEAARERGIKWYYPGYMIEAKTSMNYKRGFKPCELLIDGAWHADGAAGGETD